MSFITIQQSAEAKTITVGLTAMYPPFEFRQNGRVVGFDVDLIKTIAENLGWELTFKDMPFDELIPALNNNEIDLIISAFNFTPERQKDLAISQIYYSQNKLVWITHQDNSFAESKQLQGKKVGVQVGTILEDWAKDQIKTHQYELSSHYSTPLIIEKLKSKELDVALLEEVQGIQYSQEEPKLVYHHTGHAIGGYVIAFKKSSPLLKTVDTQLNQLKDQGTMEKLQKKWTLG